MELQSDYDNICERYLLGQLSEAECQQLEEAYFADDSLFERFLAVKDDLLDAYARGDLTGNNLKNFEQHYLASEARRQEADEARDLIQATSAIATTETESTHRRRQWFSNYLSPHPIALRAALAAAVLVIVAGGWILVRQIQNTNARRAAEEQARKIAKPEDTTVDNGNRQVVPAPTSGGEQVASSPSPSAGAKPDIAKPPPQTSAQIASITLLPVSSRDSSISEPLVLTSEARIVHLNLVFSDGPYNSFEASVRTVDGHQVVRRAGLIARTSEKGKLVTVIFDSSILQRQDHIATLRGRLKNGRSETIAEYYFRAQHPKRQSNPSPPKE